LPLRDRKRDIPDLAAHFARKHAQRLDKPVPVLDTQALSKLVTYDYPNGNVRELEEAIQPGRTVRCPIGHACRRPSSCAPA